MNVLVLHDHTEDTQGYVFERVLKCLRVAGHKAFVIAGDSPLYRWMRYSRNYTKWMTCDTRSIDSATINAYCRQRSINVVMPSDIGTTLRLAAMRDQITTAQTFPLGIPENLALLHNKWRFMQWLGEQGLPRPETRLLKPDAALDEIDLEFPLIAKPLEACGSQGVQKVDSLDALRGYMQVHRESSNEPFLIQTFIPGTDMVFGIFAEHGEIRAWTMQESRNDGVARLEYREHPELLRVGQEIARKLVHHGVAEFDVRIDSDGNPWFVECNPRLWASIVISMCMGVNYVDLGVKLAMGQAIPIVHQINGPYIWAERAVGRILRRELRFSELSKENRCGLFIDLADPIPLAYNWMSIAIQNWRNAR